MTPQSRGSRFSSLEAAHLQEHLALALAAGGFGAWEWDLRTGRVAWDEVLEAIYGLAPGTFDGSVETYRSMIHPDDREAAAAVAAQAREDGVRFETEHRVVRPDGAIRWTHSWAEPIVDAGSVVAFVGVVEDITDRREQMEVLERARSEAEADRARAEVAAQQYADLAETLQQSLLPPVPPEIPGVDVATCYHPALDGLAVGGDFYDVARIGRNTWALMLGDVCGKGARAAALTGLLRYSTRTAAMQGSRPSAVLRQVNDVLRRDASTGPDTTFATMVFARLRPRPDALEVSFAVGGHPRPYVLRADGRVETPGKDGTLLGVLADAEFNDAKVVLGPGDTFVVMTDGVLEARDAQGVELADHLPQVLEAVTDAPAAAIVGAVERVALDWQGGTPRDDIAVVALRVPPR